MLLCFVYIERNHAPHKHKSTASIQSKQITYTSRQLLMATIEQWDVVCRLRYAQLTANAFD